METQSLELSLGGANQIDAVTQIEDLIKEVERLNFRIQALEGQLFIKETALEDQARQIKSLLASEKERQEKTSAAQHPSQLLIGKRGASWM